jgi:protease FtsH subunit HflC
MSNRMNLIAGVVVGVGLLASATLFTVDQRQYAVVFQLGEIKDVIEEPGLNFKFPVIQNVRFFDRRILTIDTPEPERFITAEKQNVLVDHFVKWRIIDPRRYYESVAGDEVRARTRLLQTVNSGLREEFGRRTVPEVVSGERDRIMESMRVRADADARQIGVQIIDVRLKRVDLPTEVSESVYRRMEAERKRVANELRSEGAASAEQIRADADRQREVLIAEAYREAQMVMGQGDARATAIYADAFQKDPGFYSFYRSLEAYRGTFSDKGDVMVLDPSSDFFKFLKDPSGGAGIDDPTTQWATPS